MKTNEKHICKFCNIEIDEYFPITIDVTGGATECFELCKECKNKFNDALKNGGLLYTIEAMLI